MDEQLEKMMRLSQMAEILRRVLHGNHNLLGGFCEDLIEALDAGTPGELFFEKQHVMLVLKSDLAEDFQVADRKGEAEKRDAEQRIVQDLVRMGKGEEEARDIVRIFVQGLEWYTEPAQMETPPTPTAVVSVQPEQSRTPVPVVQHPADVLTMPAPVTPPPTDTPPPQQSVTAPAATPQSSPKPVESPSHMAENVAQENAGSTTVPSSFATMQAQGVAQVHALSEQGKAQLQALSAQGTLLRCRLEERFSHLRDAVDRLNGQGKKPWMFIGAGIFIACFAVGTFFVKDTKPEKPPSSSRVETQTQKPEAKPVEKPKPQEKAQTFLSELTLGGVEVGMSLEEMHKILGKENSRETAGKDAIQYVFPHIIVKIQNGTIVKLEIPREDSHLHTRQGIKIGSSLQELQRIYGEPKAVRKDGNITYYDYFFDTATRLHGGLTFFTLTQNGQVVNGILEYIEQERPKEQAKKQPKKQPKEQPKPQTPEKAKAEDASQTPTRPQEEEPAGDTDGAEDAATSALYQYYAGQGARVANVSASASSSSEVELSYTLMATERVGKRNKIKIFRCSATAERQGRAWHIGGVSAEQIGERME